MRALTGILCLLAAVAASVAAAAEAVAFVAGDGVRVHGYLYRADAPPTAFRHEALAE